MKKARISKTSKKRPGTSSVRLVVDFAPLNAEIPQPDALTPEGEVLRDEIVDEVARALTGKFRWPHYDL